MIPIEPQPASQTLHFAKVRSGGDAVSSLVLVNPSPGSRATGTLDFFDEAGQSWAVAVNGQTPAASVPYEIGPRGSAVFTTATGGLVRVGSARATAAEGVLGAVLRLASPDEGTLNAGPSGVFDGFVTPVDRRGQTGLNTEVALSSTGSALTLNLVLRDADGTAVPGGTVQLQVPANGQITRTLEALFPSADTDDFEGTLSVTADGGTVAATVTRVGAGTEASAVMPVTPLRP